MSKDWFQVDKEGLAKILDDRGKHFAIFELIQNSWDTRANQVRVTLEPIPGLPYARLTVEDDDPDGFVDLEHARTLFAESAKKTDVTKRGRFNLGEKLVLALCKRATITSTGGGLCFDDEGVHRQRTKLARGTRIDCQIRMTRDELQVCLAELRRLICPIATYVNGELLDAEGGRSIVTSFSDVLPTVEADAEGYLRQVRRDTRVEVRRTLEGEQAWLYEMGIPVVATDDTFHVNVLQKVPLHVDRQSVPPSYLRMIRTRVLDMAHDAVPSESAAATWVNEGLPMAGEHAIKGILTKRFGEKYASADPSDREAENRLKADGYTIVHGGALSAEVWARVKGNDKLMPLPSKICPTHPDGPGAPSELVTELSEGMKRIQRFVGEVGPRLLRDPEVPRIEVVFIRSPKSSVRATWGAKTPVMTFNVGHQSYPDSWYAAGVTEDVLSLIIHELAHHFESNHLSNAYYRALSMLGARMGYEASRAFFDTSLVRSSCHDAVLVSQGPARVCAVCKAAP